MAFRTASISTTTTTTALAAEMIGSLDKGEPKKKKSSRGTKRVVKVGQTAGDKPTIITPAAVTPSPRKKAKARTEAALPETAEAVAPLTPKKKAISTKKRKSPVARTPRPEPGSKAPPLGWEDTYSLVEELRQDKTAPVDEAGAEVLPETSSSPRVFRFQVLIALMLSSQTKDAVVGHAMRQLQQHGLTVENMTRDKTKPEQLNALIAKVGFHNRKTEYIQKAVGVLLEKYDGDIPTTAQEMIDDLPGVGPKMAYLVETIAWGTTSGIGVDTHMHRIFQLIHWVPITANTPEKTRIELEAWLPREKWSTVNYVWVGFGQESQQQKPKMLRKALDCSRPLEALKLLKRVGLDPTKEGDKAGIGEEVRSVLKRK